MSQLIKLREQIKTIKTIQKITQAMRLVSMSIHSRLNNQKIYLKNYQAELNKIAAVVDIHPTDSPENLNLATKKLIILIGSQKGLCSSFNQDVLRKFLSYKETQPTLEIMVVGKKLIDMVQRKSKIDHKMIKFTPANISEVCSHIFNYITNQTDFNEVFCLSNSSRNFFTHITKLTQLLPIQPTQQPSVSTMLEKNAEETYVWEQPLTDIAKTLTMDQLKLNIYCLLFDSLIAEYAARFRSMDNATRNASELLEITERQYRKLRQAKITRELVELSAIFQTK